MKWATHVRVGKNAAALLVGRVGVMALGLWLNGRLAQTVGLEALGRYLLALTVEGIALALVNAGLNVFAVREFARRDTQGIQTLLGTILALKTTAAVLGIAAVNGLATVLAISEPRRAAIAWASLGLLPQALNGGLEAVIKARQRMELGSLIDVGTRVIAVVAGLIWLSRGGDERHIIICAVAGYSIATVALSRLVTAWGLFPTLHGPRARARDEKGQERARLFDAQNLRARARDALRQALPFAGVDAVAILYRRVDVLLLSIWYADTVVGVYGAAYRLWELLGLLPSSFLDALFPELARRSVDSTGLAQLRNLYRRAKWALLILVLAVGSIAFGLAPWIVALLYGEAGNAAGLFRLLLIALPFTYLYLLNGHLLYATGGQHHVFRAMALVTAGNALLNAFLIPRHGIWGAASVALISEGALLALLAWTARRRVLAPNTPDRGTG